MKWPWTKPENATLKEPEWWRQSMLASATNSGVSVTTDSAMSVSAVYACVKIIAETVSSLPLKIYRINNGVTEQVQAHPLSRLLGVMPNGEQTAMDAREFIMTNVLLRGTSYSQQIRNARGQVVEIIPLNSRHMTPDRSADGSLIYDYQEPGNTRVFTGNQIWRVAGLSFDGVTGKSPIALARESIGSALAMQQHGARLFKNGLHTNLVMEFPHALNDEQYERIKKDIDEAGGITNTGKPFIAESGLKISQIGMTNDDAQFLESQKFSVTDISRWFRVPQHMVGDMSAATFSNIEHQAIEFVVHTIRPWLVRMEQTIYRDLLNQAEKQNYFARHSVEGLLRGDTATRFEAYGKGINDGWLSRNEVREIEDLNRVAGLDDYLLPMNLDQVSEREQRLADNVSSYISGAEIKALKHEQSKLSAEDFTEWLPDFYARFNARLIGEFGIDADKANKYVLNNINLFSDNTSSAAIAQIEQTSNTELAGIL